MEECCGMKELTLREIQLGELQVLKKFAEICENNGFKYFIAYGTLIGAVRHKGFIPWDDDVDVAMPRADYNKLVTYCREHTSELAPFVLKHYSLDKNYIYPISRLCDTRYVIDYSDAADYGLGLFIDIYPYDGCGNSIDGAEKLYNKLNYIRACVTVAGNSHFIFSRTAFWRNIVKFPLYCFSKICGLNNLLKKLDEKAQEYEYNDSNFLYCIVWGGGTDIKHPTKKSFFDNIVYLEFEGCKFPAPAQFDEWLRNTYGDYMQLPPEEERIAHHYYKAYLKEKY